MNLKEQAVKNIGATWLALAMHATVGFFLSPFILHRLGDEAFSLWILVFAVTGYFALLDFGIRSAIVKYTAKFVATNELDQLSAYLSTSLAFYAAVACFILAATAVGFFHLNFLFTIPPALLKPARILFLLSGASIALAFPLGVFAGVLEGLQKFSWLQLTQIGIVLLRASLIVFALTHGGGLLAVGTISVAVNFLGYVIFAAMILKLLHARLSWRHVEAGALRTMAGYGIFTCAILAAEKLRFQSDAVVIGAFLSTTAIASFSIGVRLVEYSSYTVRSMSQIFTPMSSQFHATGDLGRLQRTFIAGNRACALIAFPLCVVLVVLGKPIIECWVGARYVSSYWVLILLAVPRTLYLAQSTSVKILLGMGEHRILGSVLLLEGAVNLLLSLLLARRFGVIGVAWGTAVPLACTSLFFLPWHLCRVLDVPLKRFLIQAYRLPLLACVPMVAMLGFLSFEFPVHGYRGLLGQIGAGGFALCASLAWKLFSEDRARPAWLQSFAQLLEPK